MNSLMSDIIVPVFSAAIGAGIGGWIAFLIAKHKFSLENRDEGRAGLNTMLFWLGEISEKCKDATKILGRKPENDREREELLARIKDKHSEVDELLRAMGITKQQWESHQDHILRLAMIDITKDKDECENCKNIYRDINKVIWDTEIYVKAFNEIAKKIKFSDDTGHPEVKTMEFARSDVFWTKITNTRATLNEISKACETISESINKTLTALNQ